jgi:hypothetical protein
VSGTWTGSLHRRPLRQFGFFPNAAFELQQQGRRGQSHLRHRRAPSDTHPESSTPSGALATNSRHFLSPTPSNDLSGILHTCRCSSCGKINLCALQQQQRGQSAKSSVEGCNTQAHWQDGRHTVKWCLVKPPASQSTAYAQRFFAPSLRDTLTRTPIASFHAEMRDLTVAADAAAAGFGTSHAAKYRTASRAVSILLGATGLHTPVAAVAIGQR